MLQLEAPIAETLAIVARARETSGRDRDDARSALGTKRSLMKFARPVVAHDQRWRYCAAMALSIPDSNVDLYTASALTRRYYGGEIKRLGAR
jgi:hypothetical protein